MDFISIATDSMKNKNIDHAGKFLACYDNLTKLLSNPDL
jgi:hypothetical protein